MSLRNWRRFAAQCKRERAVSALAFRDARRLLRKIAAARGGA